MSGHSPVFGSQNKILLRAENLTIRFGGLVAVQDFSLAVPAQDIVGLIGPNGAGKTTVFNLITGVYMPNQGQVFLEERELTGRGAHHISRAGVARTFQNIRLFSGLTVLENVVAALCWQRRGTSLASLLSWPQTKSAEKKLFEQAIACLEFVGLSTYADWEATALPYGLQRKLEIARALSTQPQVILLDEPAAGMNPTEKDELAVLVRDIVSKFSIGVLLIEHDMKFVMNLCSKITVLDHGEVIAVGRPAEIRSNPKVIEAYLGADDTSMAQADVQRSETAASPAGSGGAGGQPS
jgi:branched-chain amino acid transport system ATP-binding protein